MQNHRHILLLCLVGLLVGCQSATKTPPPAPELIGGPCKYDDTASVALVSDADADQVRFLINGRVTPYSRQDLPEAYDYSPGSEFNVVEKRITEGTCTPYILEVISAAKSGSPEMPPPQPASRTTKWKYPDPSLK